MNKLSKATTLLLFMSSFSFGTCQAESIKLDGNNTHQYMSYGTEFFKWYEYTKDVNGKYVAEHGPRLNANFGSDNYLGAEQGSLKAWSTSLMFGIVNYKGSTLDDQVNVPNGTLKGKTYYNGYAVDMTRGYRFRTFDNVSFDVKGTLGGQAWLRNIRSDNVYIATQNKTRRYKAVEVSLQPYAKTALAANWHMTPDSRLSIESGVLYPIKTWTYSNQGNVWLQPESKLSPFTSITVNINKNFFVKTSYIYQRYGKSAEKQGDLNGHDVGYYQPATTTSSLNFDIGYYF